MKQIQLVERAEGNLTIKTYDAFNYSADPSSCKNIPYVPNPKLASLQTANTSLEAPLPVPVEHYHFYYTVEVFFEKQFYNQTACSPVSPLMKNLCSDGNVWYSHSILQSGPVRCFSFVSWNFDSYNSTFLEINRSLWISTFPDPPHIYIYLEDPGKYGARKLYSSLPFLFFALVCFCVILYEWFAQYRCIPVKSRYSSTTFLINDT